MTEIGTIPQAETFSIKEYNETFASLKKQIQESQLKAITAANKELISLYWTIGRTITEKQKESGWGSKFIEKLAQDLHKDFPGIAGFSRTNLFRMKAFYQTYQIVPLAVGLFNPLKDLGVLAQIPWSHNIVLMEKIDDINERFWYAEKTLENGWSRDVLSFWIESHLYHRKGKAVTNFKHTLPSPQSDLAHQSLNDPYLFDFVTLGDSAREKDIENQLINHLKDFLLELGKGFAFVGSQYPIKVGDTDYYIDLLFYHLKLRCYFVVELKARKFDSRDAGQMSLYLSAVDDTLRHEADQPTIGVILCKTKDNVYAEYVLKNFNRPIGVSEYEVLEKLPKDLKASLPTIQEIEEELGKS